MTNQAYVAVRVSLWGGPFDGSEYSVQCFSGRPPSLINLRAPSLPAHFLSEDGPSEAGPSPVLTYRRSVGEASANGLPVYRLD